LQVSKAATYTGGTRVLAGTIVLGANQALPNGGALTLGDAGANTGALFDLNSFNQTVSTLSAVGAGPNIVTNNGANSSTLTVSAASTFGGVIQDGANIVAVTKSGGGVLTLSGANTFTGVLQINAGTVKLVGGDNRLSANGTVSLGNGATNSSILQLGDANGASNQTLAALIVTANNTGLTNQVIGGNAAHTSMLTINSAADDLYQGLLGNGTVGNTAANNLTLTSLAGPSARHWAMAPLHRL
jgi:autotransporter-associated beta strand protein